ncbi:hypothetical protein NE237_007731 [Protea cynaroides]|uniref:Uncharacterized protein n=1 Tax=Protea cynaroides TaxID=273540 RepID=A0A9Q0KPR0_9MAGN|nr:hypothetical protein NE237_007731 [Protea cynaroides]
MVKPGDSLQTQTQVIYMATHSPLIQTQPCTLMEVTKIMNWLNGWGSVSKALVPIELELGYADNSVIQRNLKDGLLHNWNFCQNLPLSSSKQKFKNRNLKSFSVAFV